MAIELAINNFAVKVQPLKILRNEKPENAQKEMFLQVNDNIFIKQNYQFVKFLLSEILYLEADNIYTNIITSHKKYVIRQSIGNVHERLPMKNLIRVHRSFVVNINKIDSFNEYEVIVQGLPIPMSRTYKDEFMKYFMFR
jgi:DNA-binding LytR/AlgR family response regulator